jgi:hypothetical protein
MKKKLLNCLSFCFLTAVASQAQVTVTFQPNGTVGKDATVQSESSNANNNFGSSDHVEAAAWTYSGNQGVVRSLFDFTELSTIPANATIMDARISLYAMDVAAWQHSGANDSWIERITDSWNESTVTWNNQPATTVTNRISLAQSSNATQNYLNIDVTQLVQDMIDQPSSSYGFLIKLKTESVYRRMGFGSSDHTNPNLRPRLSVTYIASSLGLNENIGSVAILCYPNPASDLITIKTSEEMRGASFYLADQLGRVVKTGVLEEGTTTLRTDDLNAGTYILTAEGLKVTVVIN